MKKYFCLLLAAVLTLLSLCPIAAVADSSGTYEGLTYTYDSAAKTLTLSGNGVLNYLPDFEQEMKNQGITDVETLKIEEGVKPGTINAMMGQCSYPNLILPKSMVDNAYQYTYYSCIFQNITIAATQTPKEFFTHVTIRQRLELLPGLKTIGPYSFYWSLFRDSLILPEGLEKVDENGFLVGSKTIFACRLPDSLTDIGENGFYVKYKDSGVVLYVDRAVVPENAYNAERTYIAHLNGGDIKDRAAKMDSMDFETPIREGFRFAGWYDNPAFKGKPIKNPAFLKEEHVGPYFTTYTVSKLDPAVHVYAKWVTGDEPTPATGDSASPLLWAGLALSALLVGAALIGYRKHA